jgi:hypothetical protein
MLLDIWHVLTRRLTWAKYQRALIERDEYLRANLQLVDRLSVKE